PTRGRKFRGSHAAVRRNRPRPSPHHRLAVAHLGYAEHPPDPRLLRCRGPRLRRWHANQLRLLRHPRALDDNHRNPRRPPSCPSPLNDRLRLPRSPPPPPLVSTPTKSQAVTTRALQGPI